MSLYKTGVWTGSGAPNPNLASNTNTPSLTTNYFTMSLQNGGTTRELIYDEDGIPCVKITRNDVEWTGWSYMSYRDFYRTQIKNSTKYTVSIDIKASVAGSVSFVGLINGNDTNYMTERNPSTIYGTVEANKWNHLVFQCTTIADFSGITVGSQVIYFQPSASLKATGVELMIKNVKLEEGETATTWIPNQYDSLYIGNIHGFIEEGNLAKIQKNGYLQANSFIEI